MVSGQELLKPCPLCGKRDKIELWRNYGCWHVICHHCHLDLNARSVFKNDAIDKWNHRVK